MEEMMNKELMEALDVLEKEPVITVHRIISDRLAIISSCSHFQREQKG